MIEKLRVIALVLVVSFMGAIALPSQAQDRDDDWCRKQVAKAERNLDKAVHRHGEHSPQAEKRRHELEETREHCHHDHDDHH